MKHYNTMRNSLLDRKIPSPVGIVLLVISIVAIGWMQQNGVLFTSQASPGKVPENIRITNISDTSFTVSYTTKASVLGTLFYENEQTVALDDRDKSTKKPQAYTTHYITVSSLKPQTSYSFTIVSGNAKYLDQKKPFIAKTASSLPTPPPQSIEQLHGHIILPNGDNAQSSMVYVQAQNMQKLSALTRPDGTYTISLKHVRSGDLTSYYTVSRSTKFHFTMVNELFESTVFSQAEHSDPLPIITLSENYDFTGAISPTPSGTTSTAHIFGFPDFATDELTTKGPAITSPKKDEGFTDQQPLFKGTAEPNSDIEVVIESTDPIKITIQADKSGKWQFRPEQPLTPGTHTITIRTRDDRGILKTIKQSFTVYAEGSQFVEPSVSPVQSTPTPTVTRTSPTPTVAGVTQSPTPTQSLLSPTPTVILLPTATPTLTSLPILTPMISRGPIKENTGSSSLVAIGIAAISTMLFGALLFFLSRGSIRV